jgi:hypothetical protein
METAILWSLFFYGVDCKTTHLKRYFVIIIVFALYFGVITDVEGQLECIRGRVADADSGQPVADAHVWENVFSKGTVTDSLGFFEICVPDSATRVELMVSHASYVTGRIAIDEFLEAHPVFKIRKKDLLKSEVKILGRRRAALSTVAPGQGRIEAKDIERLPSFFGEPDVVRTLQQMAGIQSVSEGIGGIYVRGGGPGQNRILLDGMELMNPVHLMGLFSVFNPITTSGADVFKGHNPAFLRGGLSSSILVTSYDPLREPGFVSGSIGNIATNLAVSQKSKDGKIGVVTGFRRSYLEIYKEVASFFLDEEENYFERSFYSFYDFNGKVVYQPVYKTKFTLSWYFGNDDFTIDHEGVGYDAQTNYGNRAFALEWRQRTGNNTVFSSQASYSGTWSDFDGEVIDNDLFFRSRYDKYSMEMMLTTEQSRHLARLGLEANWYNVMPQDINMVLLTETSTTKDEFTNADISVFVEDTWDISSHVSLNAGFRGFYYLNLGPYHYENEEMPRRAGKNEVIDGDFYAAPSISVMYRPQEGRELRLAWSRNVQMLHLAALSTMPLPNDIWMMSSPRLLPQTGSIWSGEYQRQFPLFKFSSGVFARWLNNQLIFNVNTDGEEMNFEDHFYHGKGRAFGAELSVKKNYGQLQGSVNYTLSRSERSFPDVFGGEWFRDKFDRTHDLSILASFSLNDKWTFSSNWIYATGNNMTLPAGRMWLMGSVMNDYDGFNNFRLPAYHRLDLSASLTLTSSVFKESSLDFSIINVYNRANPYFIFYRVYRGDSNYDIDINAAQVSLFPIMPSLSWKFKF